MAKRGACGHLLNDDRLLRKAAKGLQQGNLIIKLNRGNHMAAGATIARGCICGGRPEGSLGLHIPYCSARSVHCG